MSEQGRHRFIDGNVDRHLLAEYDQPTLEGNQRVCTLDVSNESL